MIYTSVKIVHMLCVATSFSLFFVRGLWMLYAPQRLRRSWVRIAPHAVDAALLLSGLTLMVWSRQYPAAQNWLAVKLLAVVVYIALGLVAFRFAQSRSTKFSAWIAAQLVFVYIVVVALGNDPIPF